MEDIAEEKLSGGAHHEKLMYRAIDIVCARPACITARAFSKYCWNHSFSGSITGSSI